MVVYRYRASSIASSLENRFAYLSLAVSSVIVTSRGRYHGTYCGSSSDARQRKLLLLVQCSSSLVDTCIAVRTREANPDCRCCHLLVQSMQHGAVGKVKHAPQLVTHTNAHTV